MFIGYHSVLERNSLAAGAATWGTANERGKMIKSVWERKIVCEGEGGRETEGG